MQKSVRLTVLVLATLVLPSAAFAREPLGCNPRPQATSSSLVNSVVLALSVVSGR